MKRSQLILMSGVMSLAMALSACKKDNRTTARLAKTGTDTAAEQKQKSGDGKAKPGAEVGKETPSVPKSKTPEIEQCLKDLCEESPRGAILEQIDNSKKISDEEKAKLTEKFQESLGKRLAQEDQIAKELQGKYEALNLGQIKLSDKQERIVKFMMILSEKGLVDEALKAQYQKELESQEFFKAYQTFTTKKGGSYLLGLNKDNKVADLARLIKAEVEIIKKVGEDLDAAIEAPRLVRLSDSVQSAMEGLPVSTHDIEVISKAGYGARLFQYFLFTEAGQKVVDKVNLKDTTLRDLYEGSTMKAYLKEAVNTSETAKESCLVKAHQMMVLTPTQVEVDLFKKKAEQAQKAAKVLVGKDEKAAAAIEAYKAAETSVQERVEAAIKEMWARETQELSKGVEKIKEYKPEALVTLAIAQPKLQFKADTVCSKLVDDSVEERLNLSEKALELSWFEIKHPELGVARLAQEWGRMAAVSAEFEKEKACLKDRSGSENAEEFATLFMAKLAGEKDVPAMSNLGCFYSAEEPAVSVFPSSLVRAIQQYSTKEGKVPESCEKAVKAENEKATVVCK